MDMDDDKIKHLRELVDAARDEYTNASAYHEAWKPAAYDTVLHSRMERTYAGNTFAAIRSALRRETLLALMRLWDNDSRAVSMSKVAEILKDSDVVEALVLNRQTDKERPEKWNEENGKLLREQIKDILSLIASYEKGGEDFGTMCYLRNLRNQHLAHKQLVLSPASVEPLDSSDQAIEKFYTLMARLVNMLKGAVHDVDYRPEQTASMFRDHAKLFWDGVRGETTEGHPSYGLPRNRLPEVN